MIGDNYEADVMGAINNGFKAIHLNSNNESFSSKLYNNR